MTSTDPRINDHHHPHMPMLQSPRFANACTTPGPSCYARGLPGWDRINYRLPGQVAVTDIDGMVEIGGHFLFIEQKGRGVPIPDGQRRALLMLTDACHRITVLITRPGADDQHTENLVFAYGGPATRGFEQWEHPRFWGFIDQWCATARRHAVPKVGL